MTPSGVITLTTDFGLIDTYASVLKGVIWEIFSHARIVDLTHQILPQNVLQGGYLLATTYRYFPDGTVHVAVVDPGVGTSRPAVAVETPSAFFVAPDNGLLSFIWEGLTEKERAATQIVELTEPCYWRSQVSDTFHGRDIFAPVAAHLASGVDLHRFGRPRQQLVLNEEIRPSKQKDGIIRGRIVHVDRFGNCISNIDREKVNSIDREGVLHCQAGPHRLVGLARTYADERSGHPLILVGSSDRLEIAVRNGNAATQMGIAIGDTIDVWATTQREE
jgi:S-adenosylmethionine hydrolase